MEIESEQYSGEQYTPTSFNFTSNRSAFGESEINQTSTDYNGFQQTSPSITSSQSSQSLIFSGDIINRAKRIADLVNSFHQLNEGMEDENQINNDKQNAKKKKLSDQRKAKKQVAVVNLMNKVNSEVLMLSHGLSISGEGVIRFCYTIGQVTFGAHCNSSSHVEYDKQNQIISVGCAPQFQFPQISIEKAIDFMSHTSCKRIDDVCKALRQYASMRDYIQNILNSIPDDDNIFLQKDEELQEYIQSSLEFISEFTQQNEGTMFTYAIGRLNFRKRDIEIVKSGYSKSFLDLVGLDVDTFSNLLLRQQKIDLMQDTDEIINQSVIGLNHKFLSIEGLDLIQRINTFDGFPLKLHSCKRYYQPKFKPRPAVGFPYEYILQIQTADVDLCDLQNLIQYRQRLFQKGDSLSYDDFVRKELSFRFEDVEYSVHSQNFIEKYYKENLQYLNELEQKQQLKEQNQRKQCGFRFVSNVKTNPFQVIQTK